MGARRPKTKKNRDFLIKYFTFPPISNFQYILNAFESCNYTVFIFATSTETGTLILYFLHRKTQKIEYTLLLILFQQLYHLDNRKWLNNSDNAIFG